MENFYYPGPGAPGPEPRSHLSWYTLLSRVSSKDEAHRLSKNRFGLNYNEMFERLGIEFLHTIFPHTTTVHLGGDYIPDGFVQVQYNNAVKSYLVESKCYSSEFKIFDEIDKSHRYIQRFKQDVESAVDANYNLQGYIFLADRFDEDRMLSDIAQFRDRTEEYGELTVMCATSEMMKSTVDRLTYLYRRQPSATYRIYSNTRNYFNVLEGLSRHTDIGSLEIGKYKDEFIKTLVGKGHAESSLEERIREGLSPSTSWDDDIDIAREHYPDSDDYRPFAG